ncbi:MAG: hypothetical protein OXO52_17430 [Rhodospirillales bacterium]|nr:hypothetical protein [Rhodospirillales bacterium]MDE0379701.1 hypothetical protein [Rhodospirillales bacterium]
MKSQATMGRRFKPFRRTGREVLLLAGASLAVLAGAPAHAQVAQDERVYRQEALAHARSIEAAWRRLETFIIEESAGPTDWSGGSPPAATGWQAEWTLRGIEARYCENTLLVFLAPERLKGTGTDHRTVHAAPLAYGDGRDPALHWLENGRAEGGAGRASVALPACMSPLPSGRAALAGMVRDPFLHMSDRIARERREEDCGTGEHGDGRTYVREVTRAHNGRGDPVGDPMEGPWELSIDLCRHDYSHWEHYALECHWDAGPPHNRRMEGREVWRRLRTVTAAGESLGPPEFVSTSCWTGGALPPPPVPEISETDQEETKTEACAAGYTGSIGYRRTVTLRSTRFPWDAAPVTQTIYGDWTLARDDCVAEPEPDFRGPDHGDPGGDGPGGTAGSSGDSCGGPPPGSPVGDVCSADGSVGPGAGNGGGDGGGCFLTTAVAEWRGESDNGPTLTALRAFRDGYMMRTPERRALVTEYYAIAPAISAAIPVGHADWKWIAARIDAAVAAIAEGAGDEAFCIYVAMVRRLQERWMPAAGPASLHDGGRA